MQGINIKFPISDDNLKNAFLDLNYISKNAITSNILLYLLTEKGERYYMSDFGSNLLRYVFEPSDNITINDIINDLNRGIDKYVPGVKITNIEFEWINQEESTLEITSSNQLNLKVEYTYNDGVFDEGGVIDLTF